nr:MAG TPA: hypothetical protein [Caudoviricetes sp.]
MVIFIRIRLIFFRLDAKLPISITKRGRHRL